MKYKTLKEHHLYNKTFQKGKRFSGRYVSIFVLRDYAAKRLMKENPEKRFYNRYGVSITKRHGGAVQRNRAKRILRAAYQSLEPRLKTGFLIVLTLRPGFPELKASELEREMRKGFGKLEMFRDGEPQ